MSWRVKHLLVTMIYNRFLDPAGYWENSCSKPLLTRQPMQYSKRAAPPRQPGLAYTRTPNYVFELVPLPLVHLSPSHLTTTSSSGLHPRSVLHRHGAITIQSRILWYFWFSHNTKHGRGARDTRHRSVSHPKTGHTARPHTTATISKLSEGRCAYKSSCITIV